MLTALISLFFSALVAATLLPAQSELLLGGMLLQEAAPVWALIFVATLGNTLGSLINWGLGRLCERFEGKKWFPFSPQTRQKAELWYRKYGRWSLLLSWAPVVGDPLTLAAGVLREPLWSFICLVGLAKLARYVVIAAITLGFIA